MAHLARLDELLDRAGDVLDRHVGVDAMLVQQVDRVDPQPPQGRLGGPPDVLGPAGQAEAAALVIEGEPELGGDHHVAPERGQRLADEFLVDERAVHLGRVEERDPPLHRRAEQGDVGVAVGAGPVALAHAHGAEADRGDGQAGAERAVLHGGALLRR